MVISLWKNEDPGNYILVSLNIFPGKVMGQLTLEIILQVHEQQENHQN